MFLAIGGATGQLLEQSAQALDQISANFAAFKINENINLFCQARNNILAILSDLNDMPELMKQMPPLPVKLNEDLANSILPRSSLPKKS
ncbi:DIV and RAD interacting factor 1 [Olea europaea subsp. europaea]|uniref:DIV and RAD interacting factor 1 n=1 Tax=Olea europaea subsp. europaea TaxID=158383 RepID=A0A8S0RJH3_OLEEU|nr:DIV and RAD interacting factor 1 [Olea europaea subsp. europaea]